MNCEFKIIDKKQLLKIKPLWEKLNEIHHNDSSHFKDHFKNFTFEKRCEKFYEINDNNIRIELITNKDIAVGYCISTIEKGIGEINSLFIEQKFWNHGYGSQLIQNSKEWLKENECTKIMVTVADGHESVLDFYRKLGFYPRFTFLQLKD